MMICRNSRGRVRKVVSVLDGWGLGGSAIVVVVDEQLFVVSLASSTFCQWLTHNVFRLRCLNDGGNVELCGLFSCGLVDT